MAGTLLPAGVTDVARDDKCGKLNGARATAGRPSSHRDSSITRLRRCRDRVRSRYRRRGDEDVAPEPTRHRARLLPLRAAGRGGTRSRKRSGPGSGPGIAFPEAAFNQINNF